jgi:hypothetical protein
MERFTRFGLINVGRHQQRSTERMTRQGQIVAGGVTLAAALVVGWPVIGDGASLPLSLLAVAVLWLWLGTLVAIGEVPQTSRWLLVAAAIALSFVSPWLALTASGVALGQVLGSWLAVGLLSSGLALLIARRARAQ